MDDQYKDTKQITEDLRTHDTKSSTGNFIVEIWISESYEFTASGFVLQVR
jgi:hypothetical protein